MVRKALGFGERGSERECVCVYMNGYESVMVFGRMRVEGGSRYLCLVLCCVAWRAVERWREWVLEGL